MVPPPFDQEVIPVDVTSAWCWERSESVKARRSLVIAVRGYHASTYRNPLKATELKRTPPARHAQQWYLHAILKGMRLQHAYPEAEIALVP